MTSEAENVSLREKIIVALDTSTLDDAKNLLRKLKGVFSFYKIGLELFVSHGWSAVELVHTFGGRVFLDLKLHDIPNTVTKTIRELCNHGVAMTNVHALGGLEMMQQAAEEVHRSTKGQSSKPLLLGVTILTSHDQDQLSKELGIEKSLREEVLSLARLAKSAGLDGVVSSPQEVPDLRREFSNNFCIVTPGIRPAGVSVGDQKRVCTPREALESGVDYMVIGRSITSSRDPRAQAEEILSSLSA